MDVSVSINNMTTTLDCFIQYVSDGQRGVYLENVDLLKEIIKQLEKHVLRHVVVINYVSSNDAFEFISNNLKKREAFVGEFNLLTFDKVEFFVELLSN